MNLAEWAHTQDVHVTMAYRWYREGELSAPGRKAVGCAQRDVGPQAALAARIILCGSRG